MNLKVPDQVLIKHEKMLGINLGYIEVFIEHLLMILKLLFQNMILKMVKYIVICMLVLKTNTKIQMLKPIKIYMQKKIFKYLMKIVKLVNIEL